MAELTKDYLTMADLIAFFGCTYSTIWRWQKREDFPKPRVVPGGKIWKRSAIEAYFDGRYRPKKNEKPEKT